ncbi:MAG: DUF1080 domain-containing protein [Planctomycetaceae bacterium]|nr:DUF1080 domain-containing protein [Planctomycetaceae bacterium]
MIGFRRNLSSIVFSALVLVVGCEQGAIDTQESLKASSVTEAQRKTDAAAKLSETELAAGWIQLFDGTTLYGWEPTSNADWKVADGAITVAGGEPGFLCTTSDFGDYVFRCDFKAPAATNSGIFLRMPLKPTDPAKDCYELNIAAPDVSPFSNGGFVNRQKATKYVAAQDWRTYEVSAEGGHFLVKIDGELVLDYTDPQPLGRGRIGLQFRAGEVSFRNIRLRPLGLKSLFNGKDLTGWKPKHPESKSEFSVTPEGTLNVKNGRGQLETEAEFGDFVMQLECFSNGKQLNSGVFFRSIPGEFTNGYECQIQNGYKDGDRSKPIDCGTGGFYRRSDARLVMADDFQWFPMTLIASGPHMAAWVNGVQVSDWTDQRDADPNPRKGLRLAPGTLILQGHDPTTDLSFRKLQAAELPKR